MMRTSIHPSVTAEEAAAWPRPGDGRTGERWRALTDAARTDLVGARLVEAHADAAAILDELDGPEVEPGQLWGVWAAEPPEPVLSARPTGAGVVLDGRKLWCSGAHSCTHALVTARLGHEPALFAVDLTEPGVRPVPDSWHAIGMAASDSGAVDFTAVPAVPVGAPGDYLTRPGFWHGAIGVAACWYGGALAVAQPLRERASDDPHRLAHWGAVDAALFASRCVFDSAAADLDARPLDRHAAEIRARRVRAVVEDTVVTVIDRVGRALGAGPLCDDPGTASRGGRAMNSVERFADVPTIDVGTPDSRWSGHTRFRHLDVHECPELVVVAPHPDDEVLGIGGLASELAARGVPVTVVSVTDGEASHPGSPTLSPDELAIRRRGESDRAAARLGLPSPVRFGLPDGGVADHEDDLTDRIRTHVRPGSWCAAPLRTDGHPDHEAVGRAAARAAHDAGAVLVEYPIWLWHWAFPGDSAVPWDRARTFPLTRHRRRAKQAAVAEFATQIVDLSDDPADRAVLPPHVLARLTRDHETVFVP